MTVWGMNSLTKELADIFAEDSENDTTFYGFSESELSEQNSNFENGDELSPKAWKTSSKPTGAAQPFKLRVALRSVSTKHSTDDEESETEEKWTANRVVKRAGKLTGGKYKDVKFEDEETAVPQLSVSDGPEYDSAEDVTDSFLAKREQNIKANKAMLAQLMADLQKMPGGAGLLNKQASKQKKERSSRPSRSRVAGGELRRYPERTTRRQTRSMGGCEDSSDFKKEELELSLEEALLEVRQTSQRCYTPRPNQSKPHNIRPVEDITEDELQLVADNMTDKVYNKVTGSTCHQCRQKTVDTKTCCRSEGCRGIQGQFCGPCLRNRYGEDVKKALLDPEWKCPPCRGICNCSFCRQRAGRCPTGILFPLAQYHGFSDVHSYLISLRNKLND